MMFSHRQPAPIEYKSAPTIQADRIFNKKNLQRGVIWFVLFTIAAVASIFFYFQTGEAIKAVSAIRFNYMLVCLVMVVIDLMLGSWRNHLFIRQFMPGLSHWVSFRANTANMFMGAITPFHGGAGPAQLYVYKSYGLPVLNGFVISLINMVATLLFMSLAGLFAVWFMKDRLDSGMVPILLKYGFAVSPLSLHSFLSHSANRYG